MNDEEDRAIEKLRSTEVQNLLSNILRDPNRPIPDEALNFWNLIMRAIEDRMANLAITNDALGVNSGTGIPSETVQVME